MCDEPIFTRGSGERIIELECGHISHQQCLVVSLDDTRHAEEILEVFPGCKSCGTNVRCLPKNRDFKDKLISDYLIKSRSLRPGLQSPTARPTRSDVEVPLASGRSFNTRPSRKFSLSTPQVRQITAEPLLPSVIDLNSIISQDHTFSDARSLGDLSRLRASHIAVLRANFKDRLQYGELRLVDKLKVSRDGVSFATCACYLFETALAVANLVSEGPEPLLRDLKLFTPIVDVKVETVEESVFKCIIQDRELYLTESLGGGNTQIIQKWISGLLNRDMVFDEHNLTSTFNGEPEFVGSKSFGSLKASDSVIIRRGTRISVIGNDSDRRETVGTAMTTISSILSLKRDKPDDLVVVLQWSVKNTDHIQALDIYNGLRALIISYQNLKVCVVDEQGQVVMHALAKDFFTSPSSVNELKDVNGDVNFDPTWLKGVFYPGKMSANIGIAIISDIPMELGKSCLFLNYRAFTRIGKRRPNEIKVKVGYLLTDADYSDNIEELIEVGSWNQILEAVSYSYSLTFGDDDDEDNYSSEEYSSEAEHESQSMFQGYDRDEHSRTDSMAALFLGSAPDVVKNTTSLHLEDSALVNNADQRLKVQRETVNSRVKRAGSQSAKRAERGWDPLFEDIESAIRELQRGKSASPEAIGRQADMYNYL